MSAATLPLPSVNTAPSWNPSPKDRLAYRWVKLEGMTQSWVAEQLGIHQSTVSRMVDRYERWVAHGGPAQAGALNHEEQLRYHRWLTYERNEVIIASSLRLADEMQRSLDTSKSTTTYPASHPSQEARVRTEHLVIDRSGAACRYLRLAFRVNMEQHKLVEQDELSPLAPLAAADLDPSLDDDIEREIAASRTRNYYPDEPTITAFPNSNQEETSFPGSSLGTPSPKAPASSESTPDNPTPTNSPDQDLARNFDLDPPPASPPQPQLPSPPFPSPVVERSPDPSTLPTSGRQRPTSDLVTSLELTPASSPMLTTHNLHTPLAPIPSLTPNPTSPSDKFPTSAIFVEAAAQHPTATPTMVPAAVSSDV